MAGTLSSRPRRRPTGQPTIDGRWPVAAVFGPEEKIVGSIATPNGASSGTLAASMTEDRYGFYSTHNQSNTTDFCTFPSNFGAAVAPFGAFVDVNLAGNTNGAFIKVGTISDGWGLGVGGTTFDNTGNNIIGLGEGVAWSTPGTVAIGTGRHTIGLYVVAGGAYYYLDGQRLHGGVADVFSFSFAAPGASTSVGGYMNGATNRIPTHHLYSAVLMRGVLDDSIFRALHENVWQVFKPSRRTYFGVTSAVVITPQALVGQACL